MKHKPIKLLGVLGVITTATLIGAGEANAVTFQLDTFADETTGGNPATGLSVTGIGTDSGSASSVNSFGFNRDETLEVTGTNTNTATTSNIANNELDVQVASNNFATTTLSYSNFTDFDFTQGGSNDVLRFTADDSSTFNPFGEAEFTVTFDDGSTSDTVTKPFENPDFNSEPEENLDFFFSEFSGVDFTSIESVEYQIDSVQGGQNYRLSEPVLVTNSTPIPFEAETSIALALLGSWGAWKYWRKRRTQQANDVNSLS
jgi:hypothetical protein